MFKNPSKARPFRYKEANEIHFAATGEFAPGRRVAAPLRLRLRGDYRRAHSSALSAKDDGLERIKSEIAKGMIDVALAGVDRLLVKHPSDPVLRCELGLQRIRCRTLQGRNAEALSLTYELEKDSNLSSLSRMTLAQMRSNLLFEVGDFRKSENELKSAMELERLYSHGQLPFYLRANEIRLKLRQGKITEAKAIHRSLWKTWKERLPNENLDPLLTLLRSRIEMARFLKENFRTVALAAVLVSEALGDELFLALAKFDHLVSERRPHLGRWPEIYDTDIFRNELVFRLWQEMLRADDSRCLEVSETARTMARFYADGEGSPEERRTVRKIRFLFFPSFGVRVDLRDRHCEFLILQPLVRSLGKQLAHDGDSKAALFERVWRFPFFARHDSVLRTALYRFREQTGIEIKTQGSVLKLPDDVLILNL